MIIIRKYNEQAKAHTYCLGLIYIQLSEEISIYQKDVPIVKLYSIMYNVFYQPTYYHQSKCKIAFHQGNFRR